MKAKEKENHAKYLDLIALSKKHPEKTAKVPAFARMVQKLETQIAPVLAVNSQAQQSTKGVTKDKNNVQSDLKTGGMRVCRLLIGHATEMGKVVLASDLTVLRNRFSKATQTDFADVCTEIVAETCKLQAHWADYGIVESDVTDMEAKIALFKEKAPKTKEIKAETKKAVQKRAALFENTGSTKAQILNLSAAFISQDDEFYGDIMDAMKVGKTGPSSGQIKVVIKSGETQKPIADQIVGIEDSDMAGKTDKKGEVRFKFTKNGVFNVLIPLPDGTIKTQKAVEVKRGKTTTVIVLL